MLVSANGQDLPKTFLSVLTNDDHYVDRKTGTKGPFPQRKTYTSQGVVPISHGAKWLWQEVTIETFDDLADILDGIANDPASSLKTIVFGRVRDSARSQKRIIRRKDKRDDQEPTFEDVGSAVLHFDIDELKYPAQFGWHDPEGLARWTWQQVTDKLPALKNVAVWWQASNSAGTEGKAHLAKFHFWLLVDEMLEEQTRRAVYATAGADISLGGTVQKSFVAPPAFNGIPDPLADVPRTGRFTGAERASAAALVGCLPSDHAQTSQPAKSRSYGPLPKPETLSKKTTAEGAKLLADARNAIFSAEQRNNTIFRWSVDVGRAVRDRQISLKDAKRTLARAAKESGTANPIDPVRNGLRRGLTEKTAPAHDVWRVKPAKLPSKRRSDLGETLGSVRGENDLGIILAVAGVLSSQAPARMSLSDVRAFLVQHLPPDAISEAWIDAVMERVTTSYRHRQASALKPVQLSDEVKTADYVRYRSVDRLQPLEDIRGVHVIRAPMGSGKTQVMGAPFIKEAKRQTTFGDVWAITHRRTLVAELAQRLGLAHYEAPNVNQAILSKGGLAVCLPSILKNELMFEEPKFVFIDEIGQVLRFLTAKDHCRTADATAADVFEELKRIVREAEGVLVADAQLDDVVIKFLRLCRPHDAINIIEMTDPEDAGITATVFAGGHEVRGHAIDDIAAELALGGNVWVACEGKGPSEDIGVFLADIVGPDQVLVLTADTKSSSKQAAFFEDPEAESRKYKAVIANPVISSGVSIEHAGDPHFTLGAFIGSGMKVEPSDAAQMIRRVRYLDRFVLGLTVNNRVGKVTRQSILDGRLQAAEDEGLAVDITAFDRLVAGFQARSENLRSDFANGLCWQLEKAGWKLTRSQDESDEFAVQRPKIATQRLKERKAMLVGLSHLLAATSKDEIRQLRRSAETREQRRLLEAWDMTRALGVAMLTEEDITFYDAGGIGMLDLFEDLLHRDEPVPLTVSDRRSILVHRRLRNARRQHLQVIFEGFDLFADDFELTPADATVILDRIMDNADSYAASGAISEKYRRRFKGGRILRPKNAVTAVKDVLGRAGVLTEAKQVRCHAMGHTSLYGEGVSRDKRIRVQRLKADSVSAMKKKAQQRQAAQQALLDHDTADHVAHIERAKTLVGSVKKVPLWTDPVGFWRKNIIPIDVTPLLATAAVLRGDAPPP